MTPPRSLPAVLAHLDAEAKAHRDLGRIDAAEAYEDAAGLLRGANLLDRAEVVAWLRAMSVASDEDGEAIVPAVLAGMANDLEHGPQHGPYPDWIESATTRVPLPVGSTGRLPAPLPRGTFPITAEMLASYCDCVHGEARRKGTTSVLAVHCAKCDSTGRVDAAHRARMDAAHRRLAERGGFVSVKTIAGNGCIHGHVGQCPICGEPR